MKKSCSTIAVTLAIICLLPTSAIGQGTFQNLDFEGTTVAQTDLAGNVSATSAFPGWTVYYGTNQITTVPYNAAGIGSTEVVLLGTNGGPLSIGYRSIEGGFSVLLQGGALGIPAAPVAASIRQTGLVPASAHSIFFKAQPDTFAALSVSLNGSSIPYFQITAGPGYTLFGGDVSAFAGLTAELDLSLLKLPSAGPSNWNIDSIEFSPSVIPEPGVAGLVVLGLGVSVFAKALRGRRSEVGDRRSEVGSRMCQGNGRVTDPPK